MADSPPGPPPATRWSEWRVLRWFLFLLACGALFGPPYLEAFRPPAGKVGDFHQEWLSARNYATGRPVYASQRETIVAHMGVSPEVAEKMLPWNAHPPASVAVALPFGVLSYPNAQLAWNLLSLPLLVVSLALVVRGLGLPFQAASLLPALALALACHPLYSQFQHAQLNVVLLFLIVLAWWLDRSAAFAAAGTMVGLAAALKLFPAFLFVYFLALRRWSALATGAAAFVAANLVALALFGWADVKTYVTEVVPSVANYQSSRQNVSATGFWLRVFDPQPSEHVIGLVHAPLLGKALAHGSQALVAAIVAFAAWRARARFDCDRAFAAAVVGMLLASPIAWPHYFVMLPLPLAFAWNFARGLDRRVLFWLAFVLMMLPNYYFPSVVLGPERGMAMYLLGESKVTAGQNLTLASLPNYALAALFVLVVRVPDPARAEPPAPGISPSSR